MGGGEREGGRTSTSEELRREGMMIDGCEGVCVHFVHPFSFRDCADGVLCILLGLFTENPANGTFLGCCGGCRSTTSYIIPIRRMGGCQKYWSSTRRTRRSLGPPPSRLPSPSSLPLLPPPSYIIPIRRIGAAQGAHVGLVQNIGEAQSAHVGLGRGYRTASPTAHVLTDLFFPPR